MRFRSNAIARSLAVASVAVTAATVVGQTVPSVLPVITPAEMKWVPSPILPGAATAVLVGVQTEAGPYTVRNKYPPGFKIAPHSHPQAREVTVLSGVWYVGYGETYDASKLRALPAGSFYVEPANANHFVEVREETVIQLSGMGPNAVKMVKP